MIDAGFFKDGKMFDGSSIAGWKGINESDMVLMPDTDTAIMDPFSDEPTLIVRCNILEPSTMKGYERDPRSLAMRAEAYLKSTGIADTAYFGPENEFFVFDDVRWGSGISGSFCKVDSSEASWNTERVYEDGNMVTVRPSRRLFPGSAGRCPTRSARRDVLGPGRDGFGGRSASPRSRHGRSVRNRCGFGTLVRKADEVQILKYVIQNVAHAYGKTATFMPKPIVGDNGSGMHVHMSLGKAGKNLFAGTKYGGLSDIALYYIGGIIKHARALNAFTNPGTNSYKRLVPGFEAPVMLAIPRATVRVHPYPARSQSEGPPHRSPFPGLDRQSYLAFSAMMMAGLDGIQNKIHRAKPWTRIYTIFRRKKRRRSRRSAHALDQALEALDKDRKFLKAAACSPMT